MLVLMIVLLTAPGLVALPQQAAKPLTKDQIMTVVTAGMDNADLAKQIEARGIDFDLTGDYLQALSKAGAQEVVIRALRTLRPSPMGRDQLLLLIAGGVPSERAAALVKQRGVDFMPDDKYLESLRTAGAEDALISVVREAKPPEIQRHLARAVECEQNRAWAEAEKEYRALLTLAPGDAEFLQKAEHDQPGRTLAGMVLLRKCRRVGDGQRREEDFSTRAQHFCLQPGWAFAGCGYPRS